jgi:hypothetical protein
MPSFDVCAGGTVTAGTSSVTFTNHRTTSCTLTNISSDPTSLTTLTGQSSITVPAASGTPPVNGSVTVAIITSVKGTYKYHASCCPQAGNPAIILS